MHQYVKINLTRHRYARFYPQKVVRYASKFKLRYVTILFQRM